MGTVGGWPRRYGMMGLLVIALLLCYIDRVLISIAGIEMQREFGWSDSEKGLVFSGFFVGYLCMQLLGGILATRFGGRNVFMLAVFGWSLLTVLTPSAAYAGFAILILARFLLGFSEGAAYPCAYSLIYRRMLPGEVSRSVSLIAAAGSIGTIFALLVIGPLIGAWGWPSVFYLFGSMGIVWCVIWWLKVPAMSASLQSDAVDTAVSKDVSSAAAIPWKALILNSKVFPLYAASIALGCTLFTLASWLPSYFTDTYQFNLTQAGAYSIIPWISNALVTVWAGTLADRWIRKGQDRLAVRKKLVFIGFSGTVGGCLLLAATTNPVLAALVISLMFGSLGFAAPGFLPVAGELFPRHGPILYGFMGAATSIVSAVVVALTGVLLERTGSYDTLFLVLAALSVMAIAVFAMWGSVTPVLVEDRDISMSTEPSR